MLAARREGETGAEDEVLQRRGHDDLVGVGDRLDSGGDVHGDARDVAVRGLLALPGVQPGSDGQPTMVRGVLKGARTLNGASGAVEGWC